MPHRGDSLHRFTSNLAGPIGSHMSPLTCAKFHKLFRQFFGIFTIFDRNFAKIVAPPSDENENYVMHLKEQSILKKMLKNPSQIRAKIRFYAPLPKKC